MSFLQSLRRWRLSAIFVSTILLIGCSQPSESEQVAKAKVLIAQNDNRSALVLLKDALKRSPDSAALRHLHGVGLLSVGESTTALVELQKALELGHSENETLPELVKAMAASGRPEEAIKLYGGRQLDDRLAMSEMLVSLSAAWAVQGQIDKVALSVDKALDLNPVNTTALLLKSRLLISTTGDFEAADRINEKVLQREPRNARALFMKGRILRQLKGDIPGALAAQKAALESNPSLMEAHAEILDMLFLLKDKDGTRKQIEAMQRALPQNLNTFLFRAQMELLENNIRAARDLVQQLLRLKKPDARVLMLAARVELRGDSPTMAETYLRRVLAESPGHLGASELLAVTYLQMGDGSKALATLEPLVQQEGAPGRLLALAADAYLAIGDAKRAQSLYERAAKTNPDDSSLRTALAISHLRQGKTEVGLSELDRISETDSGMSADLALLSAYMAGRDLKAALASIDRLEKKRPNQARFAHLRGQIQLQANDVPAARASFARAIELDSTYLPAVLALSSLDVRDKNLAAAQKRFETVLAKDPANWRALLALADLRTKAREGEERIGTLLEQAVKSNPAQSEPRVAQIEFYLGVRRYDLALSAAQSALSVLGENPGLLDGLGRAQLGTKEYQQAITTFRKLASIAPNSTVPHLRMADAYLAQGDASAALTSLQRAIDTSPELVLAQVRQAEILLAQGKHTQVLTIARRLQQKRPKESTGFELEASAQLAQKQWALAVTALRAAISRTAASESMMKLHSALLALGKSSEAQKAADEWLQQKPKDMTFRSYLGVASMRAKDWARAEQLFREVATAAPNDVATNNNLALALIAQKKPGALPFAEAANKLSPNNPALMDTLAVAMADAGQTDKALELQKKVVDMAPQLMEAKLNLARIAIKSGNKALARSELEKLTYEGDKFPLQAEVQQLLRSIQ